MATYKKFSELPEITEATESTKVPVLDGGTMKLLNGAKLGGDAGVKTVIIKEVSYDTAINNIMNGGSGSAAPMVLDSTASEPVFTTSMTFEEACEILNAGEPLQGIMQFDPNNMGSGDGGSAVSTFVSGGYSYYVALNVPVMLAYVSTESTFIQLMPTHPMYAETVYYWTTDGISTELSSGGGDE